VRPGTAATSGLEPPVGELPRHEAESGQNRRSLAADSTFPAAPRTGPGPFVTVASTLPIPIVTSSRTCCPFGHRRDTGSPHLRSRRACLVRFSPMPGGVRDEPVIAYALIHQQVTLQGEASSKTTPRLRLAVRTAHGRFHPPEGTIGASGVVQECRVFQIVGPFEGAGVSGVRLGHRST
jgi:hypothetical protein